MKFGYSFEYLVHGLLLIFSGVVSLLFNPLLSMVMIFGGISFLLLKSGIEIDSKKNRIRKYAELYSLKFGNWNDLAVYSIVELTYTSSSQTFTSRIRTDTFHTRTFDLNLKSENGFEKELISFTDYDAATRVLAFLTQSLNFKSVNSVQALRAKALERRKERRR